MIKLVRGTIDLTELMAAVADDRCGATVLFLGQARRWTDGKETVRLHYEAYEAMAEVQLLQLAEEAKSRWTVQQVAIVHRLGEIAIGETCVAVALASPHRAAAFEAAAWLMHELKLRVPIWKQEHWSDETSQWIHPVR